MPNRSAKTLRHDDNKPKVEIVKPARPPARGPVDLVKRRETKLQAELSLNMGGARGVVRYGRLWAVRRAARLGAGSRRQ